MYILFSASNSINSYLIRLFCWSSYSHVDLIIPGRGKAIGAVPGSGVVQVSTLAALKGASRCCLGYVDVPSTLDAASIKSNAAAQLGRPYDWGGVFGLFLRSNMLKVIKLFFSGSWGLAISALALYNWEDTKKWFCTEFLVWLFRRGGVDLLEGTESYRVTPKTLLASDKISYVTDIKVAAVYLGVSVAILKKHGFTAKHVL